MKIESESPNELVLIRRNWLALILIPVLLVAGAVCLVIGLVNGTKLWMAGAAGIVGGILVMLFYRTVRVRCERTQKRVVIESRSVLGLGGDREIAISDIREILLEETRGRRTTTSSENQPQQPRYQYHLIFYLQNSQMIPVDVSPTSQTSINGMEASRYDDRNRLVALSQRVAEWLGVPFRDRLAPTLDDAVGAIEKIIQTARNPKTG